MSRWLALVEGADNQSTNPPDIPTKPDKTHVEVEKKSFCQVLSGCRVGHGTTPMDEESQSNLGHTKQPMRLSLGGRPITPTGRIVSMDKWRKQMRGGG